MRLLIARCPAASPAIVQALERAGGVLTDTILTSELELAPPQPPVTDPRIRLWQPPDVAGIVDVAAACYRDYGGHYHADPRLDRDACRDVYTSWAKRCCELRAVADAVLVAHEGPEIIGFFALRRTGDASEAVLTGVRPDRRGAGVYRALLNHAVAWSAAGGAARMAVTTQAWNVTVQRAGARLGFVPTAAVHTSHVWFD